MNLLFTLSYQLRSFLSSDRLLGVCFHILLVGFLCMYETSNFYPLVCAIHFDSNGIVPLGTSQFAV
jgi:hypothetical protein